MKLCIIYNFAQHYRSSIFKLIDNEFDCDWVFGDLMSDVKKMDYNLLQGKVTETHTNRLMGGWYWQPGVLKKLLGDYSHYILLGETRALSTWLFCFLARLFFPKKKVFFWSHGWYGKESQVETIFKKLLFHLPNGGVFLYNNYARQLMIQLGFNPYKLFVIHNSLDYDTQCKIRQNLNVSDVYSVHFGNSNPNLFFVGRLTEVKKLDQLLSALAICREKGHEYNLTFIGGGEKSKELIEQTEELGLDKNVWFYGPCYDESELGELIYNADLCVAPGNIGLTAMHSMVFGTPCITHDDFPYQMPEFEAIENGRTGLFFKSGNIDDLAEKIVLWLDNNSQLRENIRLSCMAVIDNEWNPHYQLGVLKENL